jgi:hypothetical protein
MIAHVVHAAAARRNDIVVAGEILDEQLFCRGGVFFAPAIAHRLTTTGLLEWEVDVATESLEQFKRCDADIGKEGIDETWNKQGNFHNLSSDYE